MPPPKLQRTSNGHSLPISDTGLNEEYSPPSSISSSPCNSPGNVAAPLPGSFAPATVPGIIADAGRDVGSTSRVTNVETEQLLALETKASSVISSKPPTEVSTISYSKDSNDGRSGISDPSTVKGDIAAVVTPSGVEHVYKERPKDPTLNKRPLPLSKRPLPLQPTPLDIRAIKASHRGDELRRLSPSRTRSGKGRLNALTKDHDGYETDDQVRKLRARRWQA